MNMNFGAIKQRIIPHLVNDKTFVQVTTLNKSKTCIVGWLCRAHWRWSFRPTMVKDIQDIMGEEIPFQLVTRNIFGSKDRVKAIDVECAITDAMAVEGSMFSVFGKEDPLWKESPMADLIYTPVKPYGKLDDEFIDGCINK